MSWHCVYTPLQIRVNFGYTFKVYYEFLEEPFCEKCSSPGVTQEECMLKYYVYSFNKVYALGKYIKKGPPWNHLLSSHIRGLKQKGYENYAIPLGMSLNVLLKNKYSNLLNADYVVPIPSHKNKIKRKGFNQTELIANKFCEESSMNLLSCLVQIKDVELRDLSLDKRYEIVKGMFEFNNEFHKHIKNKYIILLDDVVTSCATVSECSKLLIDNGAKIVDVLTCGRTALDAE